MDKLGRCSEGLGLTRRGLLTGAAGAAAATLVPRPAAARDVVDLKNHRPYRKAGLRAVQYLIGKLRKDGTYGPDVTDLAGYYKTPWLLLTGGRHYRAYRVLGYLRRTFMRANGDFMTADGLRTEDAILAELGPYMNGWIAMGAHKIGRFDVSGPAYLYVASHFHRELGGFTIHTPYGAGDDMTDGFVTAHLGLTSLYFGALDRARRAGDFLCRLLEQQPDLAAGFYLRVDAGGALVTDYPAELEPLHLVKTREPYQLYFLVGYPIGFLAKLSEATGEAKYLDGARAYLGFALSCHETLFRHLYSHQVAWGAAVVARLTGDRTANQTALRIVDYLSHVQEANGRWLPGEPAYVSFDLTAEIALWLLEVSAELVDPVGRANPGS